MSFDAALTRAEIDADYTARDCCSAAEFDRILGAYQSLSDAAAAEVMEREGLICDGSGMAMDVLGPGGQGRAAVIFLHGGYWRALGRAQSRFAAPMLVRAGVATLVPDYTLAPTASLTRIVGECRAALAHAWHHAAALGIDRDRIVAVGSSAGGHLAAMLALEGWQGAFGLPPRVLAGAMPVSGLFDLAPVARGHPQDWLSLSPAEVAALSPLRHIPARPCPMVVARAEVETAGFHRQSQAMAAAWPGAAAMVVPGRNHFDVILDLCDPRSALSLALLRLLGKPAAV